MQCPKCRLINPDGALRCDCGYDFPSGKMKESYLSTEHLKSRGRSGWVPSYAALCAKGMMDLVLGSQEPLNAPSLAKQVAVESSLLSAEALYLMCASVHIVLSRVREPKSEETKVDLLKAFQNQIQKRLARRAAHVCLVDRLPYYAVAADEPHPDLGRAYSLGKLFAKFCNRPDDPRVVMFGSTIYGNVVSVFPPILQKLFAKFEQRPPDVNQPGR